MSTKNTSKLTDIGLSYDTFSKEYAGRIHDFNMNSDRDHKIRPSVWAAIIYFDTVWVLALGFNNSLQEVHQLNLSLDQYTISYPKITNVIKKSIFDIHFHGLSGLIDFRHHDGFTSRAIEICQICNSTSLLVASFSNGNIIVLSNVSSIYLQSDFDNVYFPQVFYGVAIVVIVAVLLAFILTLTLNVLVVVYAKFKTVIAASPPLLYIAFAGCYIILISGISSTISATMIITPDSNCIADYVWRGLVHIGVTLILGIVTMRTWRVYRIFIYFTNPGHFLSNRAMICIVAALVMVDVIVFVVWVIADPLIPSVTSDFIDSTRLYFTDCVVCTQHHPIA